MAADQQPPGDGTVNDRYRAYETDDDRFVVYDADNGDAWIHSTASVAVER
ncbi:DUF7331 family protein [Halostella salina]|nr:hypothetical protein [Halostella salina]